MKGELRWERTGERRAGEGRDNERGGEHVDEKNEDGCRVEDRNGRGGEGERERERTDEAVGPVGVVRGDRVRRPVLCPPIIRGEGLLETFILARCHCWRRQANQTKTEKNMAPWK